MDAFVILTVQSNGSGGYRLGINTKDSKDRFKCRKVPVTLVLTNNISLKLKTACGNPCNKQGMWITKNPKTNIPYRKKGYDLNNKELSKWLENHNLIRNHDDTPVKLEFTFSDKNGIILKFHKKL